MQYRVSWEMPPAITGVANFEGEPGFCGWADFDWSRLDGLWMEHENVTSDSDEALDQYRQLKIWADNKTQPIKNPKIQTRPESGWTDLEGHCG